MLPDYELTVGAILRLIKDYAGKEIVDLAGRDVVPSHLLLGSDALHVYALAEAARQAEAREWAEVSASTDFEGSELSLLAGLK